MDPVNPEKVNVPVEVGLQFLGKCSRKAPWGVSQLRAESFSISMRFRHGVGDVVHMCVAAESSLPD